MRALRSLRALFFLLPQEALRTAKMKAQAMMKRMETIDDSKFRKGKTRCVGFGLGYVSGARVDFKLFFCAIREL